MSNPYNKDKRLFELLERWQSGDFSRADEQELQALADSDEFRRETVEGFWSLPEADHAAHLASIRARLRRRTGGGALNLSFSRVLTAVAAVAVLILGVVWLLPNEQKSAPTAQEAAKEPAPSPPIASNIPEYRSKDDGARNDGSPQLDKVGKTAQEKRSSPAMDAGPAASSSASEVASAPAPVIPAEEKVADKMVAAQSKPSEKEYNLAKNEQDDIDTSPGNSATRSEAGKAAPAAAKAKDALKKQVPATASTTQPAGGWNKFQDYLRRNARLPEAARQNNVSGSVRLRFSLDAQSQPINFQILRSLGYGCEEEAIRLIKAYSWQSGSDPELTLDVPFVR